MKDYFRLFAAGVAGAAVVLLFFLLGTFPAGPSQMGQLATQTPSPTLQPSASPVPDDRQNLAAQAALSTVAVQTFQGSTLVRQGTGSVLSADGLIVTTYDVAPAVRPASPSPAPHVYQVIAGERIFRAAVVTRNYAQNLVLLKVDVNDLTVFDFANDASYQTGKELMLVGKFANFSKPVTFSQRASLLYTAGTITFLDTTPNIFLSGASAIDGRGDLLGLAFVSAGKVRLIDIGAIRGFLDAYLNSAKNR